MTSEIARVPAAPRHYTWKFPGCPVRVRLSLELVEEWQRRNRESSDEGEQGVLLGSFSKGYTEIKAYRAAANGELAAAMQYSIQGLNCPDLARKDLLMDIGTEELSHLEIVGTLARMHLKPMKKEREAAEADPLVAIAGGGGATLCNSMGNPWTADYLKITGELDVDLRSNIAAEARAKIVYERLINFCDDPGTKDALQFLMTREITHMKAFMAAFMV